MSSHYQHYEYCGLDVEYWREYNGTEGTDREEYSEHCMVMRLDHPDSCTSLDLAMELQSLTDEDMNRVPLSPSQLRALDVLWKRHYSDYS